MKIQAYSLYWNNTKNIQEQSEKVMDHFGIKVEYQNYDGMPHHLWIDQVFQTTTADIIVLFDVDCVLTNSELYQKCVQYIEQNNTMIGLAHAANHIDNGKHIYVSPCFCMISRDFYNKLGKPSARPTFRADVMQEFSLIADFHGYQYKTLLPLRYDKTPKAEFWYLGNHSCYGIGTYYQGGCYNLFQSRFGEHYDLYQKRCKQIIEGTFDSMQLTQDSGDIILNSDEELKQKKTTITCYTQIKNHLKSLYLNMKSCYKSV